MNALPVPRDAAKLGAAALFLVAATLAVPMFWARPRWLAVVLALAAVMLLMMTLGKIATGRLDGVLLSGRNRYSLSRLQMVGWTWVVLSGLLALFAVRLASGDGDPLGLTIPPELLAAMGISVGSLVAAPAILSLKAAEHPSDAQVDAARHRMGGDSPQSVTAVGGVVGRTDAGMARVVDVIMGDEVANAGTIDISKLQQLMISALLIFGYALTLLVRINADTKLDLPALSENLVWLLAVSHAGYLTFKAAPKAAPAASGTQPAPMPPSATPPAPPQPALR
jgi:hypothetical protein